MHLLQKEEREKSCDSPFIIALSCTQEHFLIGVQLLFVRTQAAAFANSMSYAVSACELEIP